MQLPENNNTFALQNEMVAWMSGLVSGLQNRARRFESACDLLKDDILNSIYRLLYIILLPLHYIITHNHTKNEKIHQRHSPSVGHSYQGPGTIYIASATQSGSLRMENI